MPLDLGKIVKVLESKKQKFKDYQQKILDEFKEFRKKFESEFKILSKKDIEEAISKLDPNKVNLKFPGALPTDELDQFPEYVVPFTQKFKTHQEAREWANQVLDDTILGGSDGSQIYPSRDFNIPVSLVNIGYFINPHNSSKPYIKDIEADVLTPFDLMVTIPPKRPGGKPLRIYPDQQTNLWRFIKECEVIETAIDDYSQGFYFLDTPIVLSFTEIFHSSIQAKHIAALVKLLKTAEKNKCPILGYIDNSYARDLVELISNICGIDRMESINDAFIMNRSLKSFGDRSPVFICARSDEVLAKYIYRDNGTDKDYSKGIAFAYVKTDLGRATRVEFPTWVLAEPDLKNKMFDVIIAQSIVGNGYPYIIESCHELCIIRNPDREKFYQIFQKFSEREKLDLKIATKLKRKRLRRG